jgi:ABC-type glycerol-3-phosphate transport system substrate-binding protein
MVVLWHPFTDARGAALEEVGDRFNAVNDSGLTLVVDYQEEIYAKVAGALPDQRPDLVVVSSQEARHYYETGLGTSIPELSPELSRKTGDLLPMAEALFTFDEELHAVPLGLASYVLYTNNDWLRDLGYDEESATTIDLLETACEATDLLSGQVGVGIPTQPGVMLALLTAGGASLINDEGRYAFDDEAGVGTSVVAYDMLNAACARIYEVPEEGLDQFGRGAMAMTVGSTLRRPAIELAVTEERNFALGVSPLPGPSGPGATLWYGPGVIVVAPPGPRREAAQEVLSWFLGAEAQSLLGEAADYLPVRRSLVEERLEDGEELPPIDARLLRLELETAEAGAWQPWPNHRYSSACRAALVRGLVDLSSERPPSETLSEVVASCNAEEVAP